MKFKHLLTLLVAIAGFAACTSPKKGYTITGTVEGLPDGTVVSLMPLSHRPVDALADTVVTGGKFIFKGVAAEEPVLARVLLDNQWLICIMIEDANIEIKSKAEQKDGRYVFDEVSVSGSPLTDVFLKKMSVRDTLNLMYTDIEKQRAVATSIYGENNKQRIDSLEKSSYKKDLLAMDSLFFATVKVKMENLVLENKESFWGPLLMMSNMNYFGEEQKAWYDAFSDEAKNSYYGKMVKEELFPTSLVGTKAPYFTIKSTTGEEVTLAALLSGKKYLLLDFWASWCAPCRKEIPNLKAIYAKHHQKGFEIVSISIDKKSADWEKALAEEALVWPNFLDSDNSVSKIYNVKLIPTMYLIDENGIIVAENIRSEELAAKIEELL